MADILSFPVFIASIIFLVISGIITASLVIPLQLKEAGVKNGLAKLRQQMLLKGILALIVIITSIIALTVRIFVTNVLLVRHLITLTIFTFSLGNLGKAVIDYLIYHQQYSIKSKKLHAKMEKLEKLSKKEYK